ncbi:hypothetical protein [Rhodovulum sp. MB263]|uniref:hypothetical protein n=1 Tax=Rhodovulum sp. (strain MB263) TaxID=308754 RepID=UPI0009B77474|nr:hypothetical protein [Rhodovulum sp. MB263]ARC87382.1 hypothetical protein B5V46_01430 [Rhodovulum sp. MB263]
MTITRITHLPPGSDFRELFPRSSVETGFLLMAADRLGIERLLRHDGTRNAANPALLNGFLRHKLRISRAAPEPAPPGLVVAGCHVTYMISGEGARSGLLTISPVPGPGHLSIASLLGATLMGMRKLQKVPLLRDDGRIETVVVLDVGLPPGRHAA